MSESADSRSGVQQDADHQLMWWLILAALSSWSYMAVWSVNADELTGFFPVHYLAWTVVFLAIGVLAQRTTYALLRGPSRVDASFAVAAIVLIMLQSWNSRLTSGLDLGWRLAIHGALTLTIVWIAVRLVRAFPYVRAVLGVVTVFLVGVAYLTLAGHAWSQLTEGPRSPAIPPSTDLTDGTRDVFLVILDEYTNGSVLAEQFGFDNTEFEDALTSAGVSVVQDAMSNYTSTKLSVAGILNGKYPAVGGLNDTTHDDLVEIHSGDNLLFASLGEAGYETHLFDNAWTFTRCGPNVDVCHGSGLNELDWFVAQRTPLADLVSWLQVSPWIRNSLQQFEQATRLAGSAADSPRLVYLHALVPHAPLQLDHTCSVQLPGLGSLGGVADSPVARSAYVRQVQCVNKLVLDLIDAIPDDAIVVVTGDHGVRWASIDLIDPDLATEDAERALGVLTAYRFPDDCADIPAGASVARSAAGLFQCLGMELDDNPAYSADQSDRFFTQTLGRDGVYTVTDITQRVQTPES